MAGRVEIWRQWLIFEGFQDLLAIVEEGMKGGFEDRSESPSCKQLLEYVGNQHE